MYPSHRAAGFILSPLPGKLVKATVVDHIIPHRGDEKLFWDKGNWQALCKGCHDSKTMTEDRYQEYKY